MSVIKELAAMATKVALDKGLKIGDTVKKNLISSSGALLVGDAAEKVAQKVGLIRKDCFDEIVIKIPFLKTVEDKIEAAFAEHPERKKMCFHFQESLRSGVKFCDENANVVFEIPEDKKNLRQIELVKEGRFVGRIEKKVTISLNPFADVQRYNAWAHTSNGLVTVKGFDSSIDLASWKLRHKFGGNYLIINCDGIEIGKIYAFGYGNFALDYDESVDPVELLLSFMAIKIRAEELKVNHNYGHNRDIPFAGFIDGLKDIF